MDNIIRDEAEADNVISIQAHKKRKEQRRRDEEIAQAEQEYKEFISLLKYFVAIQTPRYDEIRIEPGNGREHMIFDNTGSDIRKEAYAITLESVFEDEINYDDLLISGLISLAPRKLVIVDADQFDPNLLRIIANVFDNVETR